MEYPFEELQKRFQELPDNLKQALSSTQITNAIKEIAESHKLMLDQQESLYNLIACVMLGIISIHDFKEKLVKEIKMNDVDAVTLINEIDDNVFKEFKKDLIELTQKSDHESLAKEGITITHQDENIAPVPLPAVPTSITPKSINVAGQSFVNAFLTKPVSTSQIVTNIPVDNKLLQNTVTGAPSQPTTSKMSPITAPAFMPQPAQQASTAPKTYTVDPYKEPLT